MSSEAERTPDGSYEGRRNTDAIQDCLSQLHAEHCKRLENVAWAVVRDWALAKDAVQEAFRVLLVRFDEIPPERRVGWLFRTTQLQAQNLRRKHRQSRLRIDSQELSGLQQRDEAGPEESIESEELIDQIRGRLTELPQEQRLVVELRLGQEMPFAEIAKQIDAPLGTVLSRMRLALKKLRVGLIDDQEEEL